MTLLIIGERINSSIATIESAIANHDEEFIKHEITQQLHAGANVIDLNTGTFLKSESHELVWLIGIANQIHKPDLKFGIAIDSSSPEAIEAGLAELKKYGKAESSIINSVTAETSKMEVVMPLVHRFGSKLIGLCMDENGIPNDPQQRCGLGKNIVEHAERFEIEKHRIYIDPLVLPISTDIQKGLQTLTAIKLLKKEDPQILTVIGLSNISYGLPKKGLLNRTFLAMALEAGLDGAILNPLDKKLMSMVMASETLLAKDDFCMNYIKAFRNGTLED